MSVSISWKPTDPAHGTFIYGGSNLHKALGTAFGEFPMTLTSKEVGILRGIAACGHKGAQELINAIRECGSIKVKAEW